jgi:hypothetical protein
MRPISAELAAVQRVRSPRAEVTATVAARGQNPTAPAVAWTEIVPNTGQVSFYPAAVVGLADGSLLRFVGESSAIVQDRVSDPTTAAGWAAATRTTVRAHGAVSLAALRVEGTIRLFYTHSGDGKVYGIESDDDGATWSSPTLVYAGSHTAFDLVAAHIDDASVDDGPWFVGFSTYNGATGEYTAHFGYFSGSWTTHTLAVGWRAAGIDPYAPAGGMTTAGSHRVYVFRQHGLGSSRLRTYEHRRGSFTQPQDIDQTQAGLFGLILAFYRFCQLPATGCLLGVAGETASGRGVYLGVTGIFHHGDPLVDEPIMLPAIATTSSGAYVALAETDGDLYLVGDTVVYRGAALPATAATLTPIAYTYDDHELIADFPAATPTLRIGQVLTLTRVLRWEMLAGSADLAFSIVRVETGTARVRVWAVDAVGFLGIARCRRPAVLHDGAENNCARVMRRLAARFGVPATADDAGLESAAVLPVTLQPSESLRGAVYRVASQTTLYLVPDNSGAFAITLINPPASDSGQYADTPHLYGEAPSEQPIAAATAVSDYRRLAFSYVLGTYSTDPEDGAALAMAAGPVIAGTRPLSYSLTNTRYNSFTRVQQAAVAEAARQHTLPVEATVEANANLALELYDVVQITLPALGWSAQRFRVRRIVERWDAGRLTQTLYLGAV